MMRLNGIVRNAARNCKRLVKKIGAFAMRVSLKHVRRVGDANQI